MQIYKLNADGVTVNVRAWRKDSGPIPDGFSLLPGQTVYPNHRVFKVDGQLTNKKPPALVALERKRDLERLMIIKDGEVQSADRLNLTEKKTQLEAELQALKDEYAGL